MDNKQFAQLLGAIMTQNTLLAKLIRRMDTGQLSSDDEAFAYASEIYVKVLAGMVTIPS
jgi:hypothetical protein